jgi:hypothetical protein
VKGCDALFGNVLLLLKFGHPLFQRGVFSGDVAHEVLGADKLGSSAKHASANSFVSSFKLRMRC